MSHDGLPVRAGEGARAARADRRASSGRTSTRRHLAIAAERSRSSRCSRRPATRAAAAAPASPEPPRRRNRRRRVVEPSVEASVAPSAPARLAIVFNEANSSKVFGGGVLNDLGDGTTAVTLGVVAIGFTDPLPANLEAGACADLATVAPSGAPGASGSPAASAEASAAASAPAASGAASAPAASPTATPVSGHRPAIHAQPRERRLVEHDHPGSARRPDRDPVRDRAHQVGRRPDGRGLRRHHEHPGRRVLVGSPGGVRSGRVASGGVSGAVRLLIHVNHEPRPGPTRRGSSRCRAVLVSGETGRYRPLYACRPLNQSDAGIRDEHHPEADDQQQRGRAAGPRRWLRAWR